VCEFLVLLSGAHDCGAKRLREREFESFEISRRDVAHVAMRERAKKREDFVACCFGLIVARMMMMMGIFKAASHARAKGWTFFVSKKIFFSIKLEFLKRKAASKV
jgi:hypothetical protein